MKKEKKNEERVLKQSRYPSGQVDQERGKRKEENICFPISKTKREELNLMLKLNSIFNPIFLSTGERRESGGGMNIFLTQNLGKGPPGRTRSPVRTCCLKPDNQPAAPKSSIIQTINENKSMKFNHLINIKNSIYYKHLIY